MMFAKDSDPFYLCIINILPILTSKHKTSARNSLRNVFIYSEIRYNNQHFLLSSLPPWTPYFLVRFKMDYMYENMNSDKLIIRAMLELLSHNVHLVSGIFIHSNGRLSFFYLIQVRNKLSLLFMYIFMKFLLHGSSTDEDADFLSVTCSFSLSPLTRYDTCSHQVHV